MSVVGGEIDGGIDRFRCASIKKMMLGMISANKLRFLAIYSLHE